MNLAVRLVLSFAFVWAFAESGRAQFTPNDPKYNATNEWYALKIGLPSAWTISQGSPSVTVAILDTGLHTNTPDLDGRRLAPLTVLGTSLIPESTMETYTNVAGTKILLHGTWVATSVAMGINNSVGGAGVGNFSILPITVTNSTANNLPSWVADGIRLAADQGAKVINISSSVSDYNALDSAAQYARGKGALVFMAAGNSNGVLSVPDLASIIFVTGTDRNDNLWSQSVSVGSSFGAYVDLAAPADDILVSDPTLGTGYGLIDGTSFASPMAAGVAALAWSINPNLTPTQVENMLFSTANRSGGLSDANKFGNGRIDAAAVAAAALASVPEPSTLALLAIGGTMLLCRARRWSNRLRYRGIR